MLTLPKCHVIHVFVLPKCHVMRFASMLTLQKFHVTRSASMSTLPRCHVIGNSKMLTIQMLTTLKLPSNPYYIAKFSCRRQDDIEKHHKMVKSVVIGRYIAACVLYDKKNILQS
jgi:hypothetical protein